MVYFDSLAFLVSIVSLIVSTYAIKRAHSAHGVADMAHSVASAKFTSRDRIVQTGNAVCNTCGLHVNRFEVKTDGSVICANCLTELK